MMEPEKRAQFEEEIQALRDKLRSRPFKELTREQVLDSVGRLEKSKFEAQQKMYMVVRQQKLEPAMINALIKVEKLRADDQFFIDTGIEEEDVEPSIKRLQLEKDPEYLKVAGEWSEKSKAFLEEKRQESEAFMKKFAEMKAKQEQTEALA